MSNPSKQQHTIDLHRFPKQYTGLSSGTLDQHDDILATGNTYMEPDSLEFDTFERHYDFGGNNELDNSEWGSGSPFNSTPVAKPHHGSTPSCSSCQRLSKPQYVDDYDLDETSPRRRCWIRYPELEQSFLNGCPVCTIIHQGISTFNDHMNNGTEQPYVFSAGDTLAVARPRKGCLSVQVFSSRKRLEYNLEIFDHEAGTTLLFLHK